EAPRADLLGVRIGVKKSSTKDLKIVSPDLFPDLNCLYDISNFSPGILPKTFVILKFQTGNIFMFPMCTIVSLLKHHFIRAFLPKSSFPDPLGVWVTNKSSYLSYRNRHLSPQRQIVPDNPSSVNAINISGEVIYLFASCGSETPNLCNCFSSESSETDDIDLWPTKGKAFIHHMPKFFSNMANGQLPYHIQISSKNVMARPALDKAHWNECTFSTFVSSPWQ
ncbi:hypothetical protein CEXT_140461, partial [Caerostris extrusa]